MIYLKKILKISILEKLTKINCSDSENPLLHRFPFPFLPLAAASRREVCVCETGEKTI
jgi:hypothetical protein